MYKLRTAIVGLALLGLAAQAQEVYVDNVVIVLDASGSMKRGMSGTSMPKIDAARNAIKEVMQTIPQSTHVGLLVFGGGADGWLYPLGPRNDRQLLAAVQRIAAGGGTPLGAYMKIGADKLLQARKDQYGYGSYRLLIVTDGEANDKQLVETYTPDIISRGIVVDAIGVDMSKAHTLATKVHSYRRANDPEALRRAIQEVFAEVGKTSDGQSVESAFDDLEGLSEEIAMAMISALVSSGNHPIGKDPRSVVVPAAPSASPSRPAAPPQAAPRRGGGPSPAVWVVVALVVVVVLFKGVLGRRR